MGGGAGDCKAFVIEQAFDFEDQVDVFLPIHAVAVWALYRLEDGKFAFPVAQHEGFQFGEAACFADAIKLLLGGGFPFRAGGPPAWAALLVTSLPVCPPSH